MLVDGLNGQGRSSMLYALTGIPFVNSARWEPHVSKTGLTDGMARRQKSAPKIPQRFERSLVSSGVLVDDV